MQEALPDFRRAYTRESEIVSVTGERLHRLALRFVRFFLGADSRIITAS